jgi:hypothetical protein
MPAEPETLQELLARIVTLEAEKAALKQEAIDQRLKYKTARERAAALETENEKLKTDHGLVAADPSSSDGLSPSSANGGASTPDESSGGSAATTFSDADTVAVYRAIATFEDRVKKEFLDDCVAAALASGAGASVTPDDFPAEVFERRGASGTGSRPPKPATPVVAPTGVDWHRFASDSAYREAHRAQAIEESKQLTIAEGRHQ